MQVLRCFRCGEEKGFRYDEEVLRDCPSCLAHHSMFTFVEMGDLLNNLYLEGTDLETFGNEEHDE